MNDLLMNRDVKLLPERGMVVQVKQEFQPLAEEVGEGCHQVPLEVVDGSGLAAAHNIQPEKHCNCHEK
jgi:hypothetical protein